jgi:hypothetical protein
MITLTTTEMLEDCCAITVVAAIWFVGTQQEWALTTTFQVHANGRMESNGLFLGARILLEHPKAFV